MKMKNGSYSMHESSKFCMNLFAYKTRIGETCWILCTKVGFYSTKNLPHCVPWKETRSVDV